MKVQTRNHSVYLMKTNLSVLAQFLSQLCLFHNMQYGTMLSVDQFHTYSLWECGIGATREECVTRCYEFFESELFANTPPIPGAMESLEQLKLEFNLELVAVTARPVDTQEATRLWLDRNFPGLFSALRYISSLDLVLHHSR